MVIQVTHLDNNAALGGWQGGQPRRGCQTPGRFVGEHSFTAVYQSRRVESINVTPGRKTRKHLVFEQADSHFWNFRQDPCTMPIEVDQRVSCSAHRNIQRMERVPRGVRMLVTPSRHQWETLKDDLIDLFLDQKWTAKELEKWMRDQGYKAT